MARAQVVNLMRYTFNAPVPLWKRYEQACDFLDEDLATRYVRVLQEMLAAGWYDRAVALQVLAMLQGWVNVLEQVASEAEARCGSLGPFTVKGATLRIRTRNVSALLDGGLARCLRAVRAHVSPASAGVGGAS
jgi:hypothetical protein